MLKMFLTELVRSLYDENRMDAIAHAKLAKLHLEIARDKALRASSKFELFDFDALEKMVNQFISIVGNDLDA